MKCILALCIPMLLTLALSTVASTGTLDGRRLFKFQDKSDFADFRLSGAVWDDKASGVTVPLGEESNVLIESSDIEIGFPTDEIVISWNALTPPGSYLTIYIQARSGRFWSRRFAYAIWNRDHQPVQRMCIRGQQDDIAELDWDVLTLKAPADAFRISAKLSSLDGKTYPTLRLLGVHCLRRGPGTARTKPKKDVWGTELPVPQRSQLTVPEGNRFCSATSTSMVLEYWAHKLNRPELNVHLQTAVDGIMDMENRATGAWPFNTAYAGEFGGLRAYVTRFRSTAEAEEWIAKGVPVIISIDHNIIRGRVNAPRAGHLMVLTGFTKDGQAIINDPYTKLDQGEVVRRVFDRKLCEDSWIYEKGSQGAVYLIYPDDWDVPANKHNNW